MKRFIVIKLKCNQSGIGAEYRIDQMKNAEHVWVKGQALRVGCAVTQPQADELCNNKNYEVTISL